MVLARVDKSVAIAHLKSVATWLLDRHDPDHSGLGLADLQESEEVAIERLVAGPLAGTTLGPRRQSYIATVLLDLILATGDEDLYEAVRANFRALRIVPTITAADESKADWRRGGADIWPQPRVDYEAWADPKPSHHLYTPPVTALESVLLSSVCRSRHYATAITALIGN